ncbi:hypothetical protein QQS21_010942 [Conoideocrella luteorostrata]|uniref:Uncharacterized protein n=1 Tax=Conoideocrella luteorostrata TaxID=1105319 RepID=A0AAJ0CE12_9HYPO|nr:hypothetical protein QQS21_010942 [Conoideocrella luteorostrata]
MTVPSVQTVSAPHDEERSAFKRVKNMKCFERFTDDIGDKLIEFIDQILSQESTEPDAAKRNELAELFLWHAEFESERMGEEKGKPESDEEMRAIIAKLETTFGTVAGKEAKDATKSLYEPLIKRLSIKKNKLSRSRRNESHKE